MANDLDAAMASKTATPTSPVATAAPIVHAGGNDLDAHMQTHMQTAPPSHTVASPYAQGAFVDPTKKPAVDTSKNDAAIAAQGVGDLANGVFELMNRPTEAAYAKHAGKGYWNTIMHGDDNYDADREKAYKDFGNLPASAPLTDPVGQAALDTLVNPLSLLGMPFRDISTMARITNLAEEHGMPLVMKAGEALNKVPGGQHVTNAISVAHDLLGVHSEAKRALATLHGSKWLDKYALYRAKLMMLGGEKPEADLEAQIMQHLAEVPPAHRASYEKALIRGGEGLPFAEQIAPAGGKMRTTMATGDPLQRPLPGMADPNPQQEKLFQPPLKPVPPTVKQPVLGHTPEQLAAAAKTIAQRAGAPNAEDTRIMDMMKPASGWKPEAGNRAGNALKSVQTGANNLSDWLTAGMFSTPFGHAANVSFLGALADPAATMNAIGRAVVDTAKQPFGKGESDASVAMRHAAAKAGGAISSHIPEEQGVFDSALDAAKTRMGVLGIIPKAVKGLYAWSGKALWKFDDEVKTQRFNTLVKGGMTPERAGLRVGGELVDYENKSPIARGLHPFARFATWRTKAPLAVTRNAIENPGRVQFGSSLAPAAFGGTQGTDPESGEPYKSSLPGSETNQLTSILTGAGPKGTGHYAVGSLSTVSREVLDGVGSIFALGSDNPYKKKLLSTFATYGVDPSKFMLNELPLVGDATKLLNGGMFGQGTPPGLINDLLDQIRTYPGH